MEVANKVKAFLELGPNYCITTPEVRGDINHSPNPLFVLKKKEAQVVLDLQPAA